MRPRTSGGQPTASSRAPSQVTNSRKPALSRLSRAATPPRRSGPHASTPGRQRRSADTRAAPPPRRGHPRSSLPDQHETRRPGPASQGARGRPVQGPAPSAQHRTAPSGPRVARRTRPPPTKWVGKHASNAARRMPGQRGSAPSGHVHDKAQDRAAYEVGRQAGLQRSQGRARAAREYPPPPGVFITSRSPLVTSTESQPFRGLDEPSACSIHCDPSSPGSPPFMP